MPSKASWWAAFRYRHILLEGLVALSLALLIWLYAHSRDQTTIDHVQVPVQIQLTPSQRDLFSLEIGGPARVTASFSGPASRLRELRRQLQRSQIVVKHTLTVRDDRLNESTLSETVRIDPSHVPVPPGVLVDLAEDTNALLVTLHRMIERPLPVRLDYSGDDVRVSGLKVEPSTVLVRGPKHVLDRAQAIPTQPYAMPNAAEGNDQPQVRGQAPLVSELDGRPVVTTPNQVAFRCQVHPKQKIYEIKDVPVRFLCPDQFPYRPRFADDKAGRVTVKVLGPTADEPPPVVALVDLTGANLQQGRNLGPVRVQLPRDFTLVNNTAAQVAFVLDEPEKSPAREPATGE